LKPERRLKQGRSIVAALQFRRKKSPARHDLLQKPRFPAIPNLTLPPGFPKLGA
jgi:hypothetical protein